MSNTKPQFKIVLHTPEIPGNTGSIGRTCVALNAELILIKPYGFDITEKALRRAGLDYWKHVQLKEYENWNDFLKNENPEPQHIFYFENYSDQEYFDAPFEKDCYLVLGAETIGLPEDWYKNDPKQFYKLPMYSEHIRSLNLSNAATAVAYECIRKINLKK